MDPNKNLKDLISDIGYNVEGVIESTELDSELVGPRNNR